MDVIIHPCLYLSATMLLKGISEFIEANIFSHYFANGPKPGDYQNSRRNYLPVLLAVLGSITSPVFRNSQDNSFLLNTRFIFHMCSCKLVAMNPVKYRCHLHCVVSTVVKLNTPLVKMVVTFLFCK